MNVAPPAPGSGNSAHREPLIGLPTLMTMALSGEDLTPLGSQLMARAEHPDDGNAWMDLSTILQLKGNHDIAMSMQAEALKIQQLYQQPATGQCRIRLLAIMSSGDLMSNTPVQFLVEGSDISLDMLYVTPNMPLPDLLPEHDLVFIAVGESDENRPLLQQLAHHFKSWPRPVLNAPDRIASLSRDSAYALLKSAPGVLMPITVRVDKWVLEKVGRNEREISSVIPDSGFPVIVRPVGSHAGRGLMKLDSPAAITDYLQSMPDNEFYIAPFVDYQGSDGLYRKSRIVLIEGRPFICHMAISEHWMIHYLNAGMADSAAKRDEEAQFMANFDNEFAMRHAQAFRAINERIGLDYLGIDCAETTDGQLLIFEVDSNMIVHAMDPADVFPYKQPQMRKVFAGFRQMLINTMQRTATLD